jgi:hypothetical protein
MIVKLRVTDRPFAAKGSGGWTYIDGVERVETHEGPLEGDGSRHAFTKDGLIRHVADAFGESGQRGFKSEVWPQNMDDKFCRYVALVVAYTSDDAAVLIVATDHCYLLGENGQTIDRLY